MADIPEEVATLLTGEPLVAHLATSVDDRPHVAPVWFRYEDGVVEVVTTGRKLANVRENPLVALSIQRDDDGDPQWMVTMRGRATVVDDEDETRAAARRINRRYGVPDDAFPENVLVRIDVGSAAVQRY